MPGRVEAGRRRPDRGLATRSDTEIPIRSPLSPIVGIKK